MAAIGMNAATGREISDADHLRQSVAIILTTPLGTRLMRRDFGSLLPELIDQPLNPVTITRLNAATVMALMRWEKRLQLSRVSVVMGEAPGAVTVEIAATRRDGPLKSQALTLSLTLNLKGRP